jgi:hypothetical protein
MKLKGSVSGIPRDYDRDLLLECLTLSLARLGARDIRTSKDGRIEFGVRSFELSNPWGTIIPFDYGRLEVDWAGHRVVYALSVRMAWLMLGGISALSTLMLCYEGGWRLGVSMGGGLLGATFLILIAPQLFAVRRAIRYCLNDEDLHCPQGARKA